MAEVAVVPRQLTLEVKVGERSPAAPTEVAVDVVVVVAASQQLFYSFLSLMVQAEHDPGCSEPPGAVYSRPATAIARAGPARNARPASYSLCALEDWRLRRWASIHGATHTHLVRRSQQPPAPSLHAAERTIGGRDKEGERPQGRHLAH